MSTDIYELSSESEGSARVEWLTLDNSDESSEDLSQMPSALEADTDQLPGEKKYVVEVSSAEESEEEELIYDR